MMKPEWQQMDNKGGINRTSSNCEVLPFGSIYCMLSVTILALNLQWIRKWGRGAHKQLIRGKEYAAVNILHYLLTASKAFDSQHWSDQLEWFPK